MLADQTGFYDGSYDSYLRQAINTSTTTTTTASTSLPTITTPSTSSLPTTSSPNGNSTTGGHHLSVSLIVGYSLAIVALNVLSALFSGLVLGLLSLDVTDLEILRKCGTPTERINAASIIPMRKHSNLLLCSLVFGNVMVNAFMQVLLDQVLPGWIGFVVTTICITIMGEIVPQAVCSRHGLAIGARTIWLTWIIILLTLPVSFPLSKLLDCVLGEEIAFVYDRERLQEYLRITRNYNHLDAQEVNIIMGALKIKKVTASQVMTKLKDVFMLDIDLTINYQTIATIIKRGFSRIPVYERSKRNVVGILMVKDLALVNPYREIPLRTLLIYYKHPLMSVEDHLTLDVVFNHFREGKSHIALVKRKRHHEIIGIVTLEDIIEEVLQVEINDETDIVFDNRDLRHRPEAQIPMDIDAFHVQLNQDPLARRKANEKTLKGNPFGPKELKSPMAIARDPYKTTVQRTKSRPNIGPKKGTISS